MSNNTEIADMVDCIHRACILLEISPAVQTADSASSKKEPAFLMSICRLSVFQRCCAEVFFHLAGKMADIAKAVFLRNLTDR